MVSLFCPPSMWMLPKCRDVAVEACIKKVRKDMAHQIKLLQNKKSHDNFSSAERITLKKFQHQQETIIKPANKGSTVVVFSNDDYINEAIRQLSIVTQYHELPSDPTAKYAADVKQAVESLFSKGVIDQQTKEFLTLHLLKAAILHLLLEIHKPCHPG